MYTYIIGPDGHIRACSSTPLTPTAPEIAVRNQTYFKPGKYRWDFTSNEMIPVSPREIAKNREALLSALKAAEDRKQQLLRDLRAELAASDEQTQTLFRLFGELVGVSV